MDDADLMKLAAALEGDGYACEDLITFVGESNRIEGIFETTDAHIRATEHFLNLPQLEISDLEVLVYALQPDARLRDKEGLNVRVGSHIAPPGGPRILADLGLILHRAQNHHLTPYHAHIAYETLHPFTDGNGRSGRALWAWQMLKFGYSLGLKLGFLHAWYYQSLQHADERRP